MRITRKIYKQFSFEIFNVGRIPASEMPYKEIGLPAYVTGRC